MTLSNECPCGRARAGCEYHDPALQPLTMSIGTDGGVTHGGSACSVPCPADPEPVDLQDGGTLQPCVCPPGVSLTLCLAFDELSRRRHGAYSPGWAFHQDPPGTWILADVPAGFDRAAIGFPVATQAP
jgi:hypothetical protein